MRFSWRLLRRQSDQQRHRGHHRRGRHFGQHSGDGRHPGSYQPERRQLAGAGRLCLLLARRLSADCLSRCDGGRQPGALLRGHGQLRGRLIGHQLQRLRRCERLFRRRRLRPVHRPGVGGCGQPDQVLEYRRARTHLHHAQRQPVQLCPRHGGQRQRHDCGSRGAKPAHRLGEPDRQRRPQPLRGHRRSAAGCGQLLRRGGQPARRNLSTHRRLRGRRQLCRQQVTARHPHHHSGERYAGRHRLGMEPLRSQSLPAFYWHHPALRRANLSGCPANERQCHHRLPAHPRHRERHFYGQAGNGDDYLHAAA